MPNVNVMMMIAQKVVGGSIRDEKIYEVHMKELRGRFKIKKLNICMYREH